MRALAPTARLASVAAAPRAGCGPRGLQDQLWQSCRSRRVQRTSPPRGRSPAPQPSFVSAAVCEPAGGFRRPQNSRTPLCRTLREITPQRLRSLRLFCTSTWTRGRNKVAAGWSCLRRAQQHDKAARGAVLRQGIGAASLAGLCVDRQGGVGCVFVMHGFPGSQARRGSCPAPTHPWATVSTLGGRQSLHFPNTPLFRADFWKSRHARIWLIQPKPFCLFRASGALTPA